VLACAGYEKSETDGDVEQRELPEPH